MGVSKLAAACVAAAAMACAASAGAGVVFTSIPDLTVAPAGSWDIGGPEAAGLFTLSQSEWVWGVQFVTTLATDPSWFGVEYKTDNGGKIGNIILGYSVPSGAISYSTTASNTRLVTINMPEIALPAGSYWLEITGLSGAAVEGFDGSGSMLTCHWDPNCTSTGQTMGFDVTGPHASAAPEPSTWAMMILGLGLLGAALRRRPRAALPAPLTGTSH